MVRSIRCIPLVVCFVALLTDGACLGQEYGPGGPLSVQKTRASRSVPVREEADRVQAGLDALSGAESPLRNGDKIAFIGDLVT